MFTQISLERHSAEIVENFERSVRDAPEVLECYAVTGDADFLLKIVVASPEAYDSFLHRFLFNLPGVRQTRTIVALREIKHDIRSEEHTSELQSLMRISYAVFCLKKT